MFLSDASLKRPIAMTVCVIVLALFGFLSLKKVGYDQTPRMDIPYVTVTVVYPGASPEEIETSVAKRIEDAVSQVDGLKHVTSTCVNNYAAIFLEFQNGRDVDQAATDVRAKLDTIKSDLPTQAELPQVMKFDMNATAVVTMALTGKRDILSLYDYADNTLKSRFSVLSGVASVGLVGGEKREVVVELDREKVAAKGLSVAEIVRQVGKGNLKIPSGDIDDHGRNLPVTFDAQSPDIQGLGDIQLGTPRGDRVYLRDVATFHFASKKLETLGYFDDAPAIILKISKRGEANAIKTVQLIREAYEKEVKNLPKDLELHWVRDDGDFIAHAVGDGWNSIWQSIALTGIILLLFLADWRTAFAAFVSIPVTVIIAIIVFPLMGYTFDLVTMSAIGITTGILVANSIVVLENISGKADIAKAIDQVAIAVAASALTNIVVFLPMSMMTSTPGRILSPFAIVITAATFASLFVSFTLTPIVSWYLGRKGAWVNRVLQVVFKPWNLGYGWVERAYNASLRPVLRYPRLFVTLVLLATAAGFYYATRGVQMDFFPDFDKTEATVRLEFPPDYSLAHTAERVRALAAELKDLRDAAGRPFVRATALSIGKTQGIAGQVSRGAYMGEITCVLSPMTERRETIKEVQEALRGPCRKLADCSWSVLIPTPTGGASQMIQCRIQGDDFAALDRTALGAVEELEGNPLIADLDHNVRPGKPEIRIFPRRAVLNDMGLSPDLVGTTLRANLAGLKPSTFTKGDRSYDVRVRFRPEEGAEQVAAFDFPLPDGTTLNLDAFTTLSRQLQRVQILRSDKRRAVTIFANNSRGNGLVPAIEAVEAAVTKRLPEGYDYFVGGMAEMMGEVAEDFKMVTVVAILLTYLLLAATLESWTGPFMILFTVPFSYLGLFLALKWTHTTFSMFGMLAGIMLVGVVVNAAILIIDEYNQCHDIALAAKRKFRPVVMSAMAALFGMLPMALGGGYGYELRSAIGIGSVGGIVVSSLAALYFIPALCACRPR